MNRVHRESWSLQATRLSTWRNSRCPVCRSSLDAEWLHRKTLQLGEATRELTLEMSPIQLNARRRHARIDREYNEGALDNGDNKLLAKQIEDLKMEAKGKGYDNTNTMFTARMRKEVGDRSNVVRLRLQYPTSEEKYEYILFAHKSEPISAIGLAWLKHLWEVESEDRVGSFNHILNYGEKGKPCARPFRCHADQKRSTVVRHSARGGPGG